MKSFDDLEKVIELLDQTSQIAVEADRIQDKRLWRELQLLLSNDEIDFSEASGILYKIVWHYGTVSKVPSWLIVDIADDGNALNGIRIEIMKAKLYPHGNIKNPITLKKRFEAIKHRWNKNVLLAIKNAAVSTNTANARLAILSSMQQLQSTDSGGDELLDPSDLS